MPNKLFGLADPQYDALRVFSNQALQPGPGDGITTGGGLLNRIYLWPADGSPISDFDPDQAGLIAALAAAVDGDTVWIPSMTITLTAGVTVPAGAALAGMSHNSTLSFSGFSGVGVTLNTGSILWNFTINFDGAGFANAIGAQEEAADALIRDVDITVSGATDSNVCIGTGSGIVNAREVWVAVDTMLFYSTDFDFSGATPPTWEIVAALPTGTIKNFAVTLDGSTVYATMNNGATVFDLYKCTNPKDPSPTWTRLIGQGDVVLGKTIQSGNIGFYAAVTYGNILITNMRFVTDVSWLHYEYDGSTATLTNTEADSNESNMVGYQAYVYDGKLRNLSGGIIGDYGEQVGNASSVWRNLLGGDYFGVRPIGAGNNEARLLNISTNTTLVTPVATGVPFEGLCRLGPRGAHYGTEINYVDYAGNLYTSADGASYTLVDTWVTGAVEQARLVGGGPLVWMRGTAPADNEVIRVSNDGGSNWDDMTGNFWSFFDEPHQTETLINIQLVF